MLNFLENVQSKKITLVLAAYGIVQVLAQDLGIKQEKNREI